MAAIASEGSVISVVGGGTTFVAGVGATRGSKLLCRATFPTGECPTSLFDRMRSWWKSESCHRPPVVALSVGSFGPCGVHQHLDSYGYITTTPKKGWSGTDVLSHLRQIFGRVPTVFETDCNVALAGEVAWGAGRGLTDVLYITMGTGIGSGSLVSGKLVHGLIHPETGHMRLPRIPGDGFAGSCERHGADWEGLCSGPAIEARTGTRAEHLQADDPVWGQVAQYTATAVFNLCLCYSPQRVIIGGSVRKAGRFGGAAWFDMVCKSFLEQANGYLHAPEFTPEGISNYIVPPGLGDDSGVLGGVKLAQDLLVGNQTTGMATPRTERLARL